jgi:hypothetical protein
MGQRADNIGITMLGVQCQFDVKNDCGHGFLPFSECRSVRNRLTAVQC